ncbi:MAG: ferrous iron transporter B [Deltaproteobacteria bacterium]|nr:MAG: ferrous iron transporter B [Deltaproteobacteria bacterium]
MTIDSSAGANPSGAPDAPLYVLVGSPNSGKSTLFNALTGLRVKVANYPGVTVERFEGVVALPNDKQLELVDLPGTYSLEPLSPEEQVTVSAVQGQMEGMSAPEGILFVCDCTSLERTLPQLGALLHMTDQPVVLVLTMLDELKARKGQVHPYKLERDLGIPVVGVVGNRGVGIQDLKDLLASPEKLERRSPQVPIPEDPAERFVWADEVLGRTYKAPAEGTPITDMLDKVLLHPVWGILVFLAVMVFFFQAIFQWAGPLQDGMEAGVLSLSTLAKGLPDGFFRSLLVDGIIAGVGGVVVFVPQIAMLFLLITLLEQVGYMSRAVFIIDRMMGWVGLDGRSFVSMLSSYACAIPGIMAARNIPDPKNRLVTILASPLMTCSARLPVYTLLIAAFVPATTYGIFNLQGLVMLGLYLLGGFAGMFLAMLLRRGPLRGSTMPFYIELPPYRAPTLMLVARAVWVPVWRFIKRAGTLILAASILLWLVLNYPQVSVPKDVTAKGEQAVSSYKIEHSYAAKLGKTFEPVIAPLGFDWRVGIGLIASLAAREVVVATLAQTYAVQASDEDTKALRKVLVHQLKPPNSKGKNPVESLAVALSLLMFFVFALQCVSTLAVMQKETGSWKWPAISFFGLLGMAYIASFVTFQLTLWIGGA